MGTCKSRATGHHHQHQHLPILACPTVQRDVIDAAGLPRPGLLAAETPPDRERLGPEGVNRLNSTNGRAQALGIGVRISCRSGVYTFAATISTNLWLITTHRYNLLQGSIQDPCPKDALATPTSNRHVPRHGDLDSQPKVTIACSGAVASATAMNCADS